MDNFTHNLLQIAICRRHNMEHFVVFNVVRAKPGMMEKHRVCWWFCWGWNCPSISHNRLSDLLVNYCMCLYKSKPFFYQQQVTATSDAVFSPLSFPQSLPLPESGCSKINSPSLLEQFKAPGNTWSEVQCLEPGLSSDLWITHWGRAAVDVLKEFISWQLWAHLPHEIFCRHL